MKVIKESFVSTGDSINEAIETIPEVENKAQVVVDPVMGAAKEYSDKCEKEAEKQGVISAEDAIKQEPITGHKKKDYPKKVELPKATLDESLFDVVDEDVEMPIMEADYSKEKLAAVMGKFDELENHYFGYAMNSEKDKQDAIDECNKILNILNSITAEDIELSQYIENEASDDEIYNKFEGEDEEPIDDVESQDEFGESLNEGKEIAAISELAKAAKNILFTQPWRAKEILMDNPSLVKDFIESGLSAEDYLEKEANYYGVKKYADWFGAGCPTKFVKNYHESLEEDLCDVYGAINYTSMAMTQQGLSEEIGTMRERALSEDYKAVCSEYIDKCNLLAEAFDDDYIVEGLPFVTQGIDLDEARDSVKKDVEKRYLGKKIRINNMEGEPHYNGREGEVDLVDDALQLHGTWGGLAVNTEKDDIEIIG